MRLLPPILSLGPSWRRTIVLGISVSLILSSSLVVLWTLRGSSEEYLSAFSPEATVAPGENVSVYIWGGRTLFVLNRRVGGIEGPPEGTVLLGPEAGDPGLGLAAVRLEDTGPFPPNSIFVNRTDLPGGARRVLGIAYGSGGGTPVPSILDFLLKNLDRLVLLLSAFGPLAAFSASLVASSAIKEELERERVKYFLLSSLGVTPREIKHNLALKAVLVGLLSFSVGAALGPILVELSKWAISRVLPFMAISVSAPLWLVPLLASMGILAGGASVISVDVLGAIRFVAGRVRQV